MHRFPDPQPLLKRARIEIVPLIDIMFFLLASFMLVSLTMVRLQGMQMTLPGRGPHPVAGVTNAVLLLTVSARGELGVAGGGGGREAVLAAIAQLQAPGPLEAEALRVLIKADADATHGAVIDALDLVRSTGVRRVTFGLRPGTRGR